MLERLAADPYFARRGQIIAKGAFSGFNEMYYAAAEIFFDALSGKAPDQSWKSLFESVPDWTLGADLKSEARIYAKVALALLGAKSDAEQSRQMFKDAARESLAAFERGRGDGQAFPLPSLLDKILLTIAEGMMPAEPKGADADLLLGSLELIDRNPRYVVSDSLAMLAAQRSDEQRHAAHALLRLTDRRQEWEAEQLQVLAARIAAHRNFPAQDFTPQLAAQNFADSLARLAQGVTSPPARLPRLAELQAMLAPDEAFVGYVQGLRVCVRSSGAWNSRMSFDAGQLGLDVKLLSAALSAQNAPSDRLDSQYPVAAAMRLYQVLLGDLGSCLSGAHHLIYFPPGDVQAIPLSALLRAEPPKTADGYDLSRAQWLIFDYAVSTVTSIRDFLSSRSLSLALAHRPGALAFAGIGDPKLSGSAASAFKDLPELPETRDEVNAIARLFKTGADLRLGAAATEENFRSLPLEQYRILHFATHGLMRDDIGGLSQASLVFTPGDAANRSDDGLLTTADVANLNLAARLVVLSACNTANFDPTIFTSQLQGLASAFAAAGAPTTVASLWSVNNQTGMRLMVRFYQKLLGDGAPGVAVALQQAMIEIIRQAPSPAFANPRFWAPFIVLGDGGVRVSPANDGAAPRRGSQVVISPGGGEIL
ncbi:MAG: CHAT domain-containing protein, partial [Rhizomicrobium sp.]